MAKRPQEIHLHSGRSSRGLLDPRKILEDAGLKKGDTFLDAGCGEEHFSIAASQIVGKNGTVYAFDIYLEGINKLKKESKKRNLENMHAVVADITRKIPLKDKTVDFCLLSDVLHGLVANQEVDDALKRLPEF